MLKIAQNLIKPTRESFQHYQWSNIRLLATGPSIINTPVPIESTPAPPEPYDPDSLYKRLEVELKGCDPAVLKSYEWFATTAANHLGIQIGKCWAERKSRKHRLTLLKCVHIQKKHRVQYEMRTYYRFLEFHKLTGSTLCTFLEYIERNLPEGVALKATKIEIQPLPEHLKQPPERVE